MEFATTRLRMRPLDAGDEALFCELHMDPETMRYIGPAMSLERARHRFARVLQLADRAPALLSAIVDKASARTIGICTILNVEVAERRAEAGFMLQRSAWAQGFAAEGLDALVTAAFAKFDIDEVWARVAIDHAVVKRLLVSVGFQPSGIAALSQKASGQRWSVYRSSWRGHTEF